jgi:NitT/TauT family transport system substrate-binding protein
MRDRRAQGVSRREFLGGLTLAATAGLLGWRRESATAESPPETTTLRVTQGPSLCQAPQAVAEALLRGEGFSALTYVKQATGDRIYQALAAGEADVAMQFSGPNIIRVDKGDPLMILAGIHIGCFELFGTDRVRAVRDLKGKKVAVSAIGSPRTCSSPSSRPTWAWTPRRTSPG